MKELLVFTLLFGFSMVVNAQSDEQYFFNKTIEKSFEQTGLLVKKVLKEEGFGVITEVNMHEKISEKLDVNMAPYKLLGVCNAGYAHRTLQLEENIGLFLPCKVLIKQVDKNTTEIVIVNPSAMMKILGNEELDEVAEKVTGHFKTALSKL